MPLLTAFILTQLLAQVSHYLLPTALWPARRSWSAWLLQILSISFIYSLALLLTQRPVLAGIISLSVLAVALVINHAKYHALSEPLVFSDGYLYLQVIRHPRLFLPFLNIPWTLAAIVIGISLLAAAISLEPAYRPPFLSTVLLYISGVSLLALGAWLINKLAQDTALTLNPVTDIQQQGFYNSLLIYSLQAGSRPRRQALQNRLMQSPFAATPSAASGHQCPHVIVIQSESFFDARRLHPAVKPTVLSRFDDIREAALQHGLLTVPAWGANTLRPEFAFLSGIDNRALQHYRFNPYQYLQDNPTPTLAAYLKKQGYRCIAIHPNSSAFFGRDKVFPLLGFDEFIDITAFNLQDTAGPYISDAAVQEKIARILHEQSGEQPLFIFAITMENHGPLHLEAVNGQDIANFYQAPPPKAHSDLTVYLRHLANADQSLADLTQTLSQHPRDSLLCFYGDHVPSMPNVYAELNFQQGQTDYLLWHSNTDKRSHNTSTPLRIENLGTTLLRYL